MATTIRLRSRPSFAFRIPNRLRSKLAPSYIRNASNNANGTSSGPEPAYSRPPSTSFDLYRHPDPWPLIYSSPLQGFEIAYETWGQLNSMKSNAILLHTGLSASSHAKSTSKNPARGWWEEFIGPGRALDTDQFFVICTNVLGGCYGSTGPASPFPPSSSPFTRYGSRFPLLSIHDMVRAQFRLLDELGISRLYASVGSSMGGMSSISSAHWFPERVSRVVSISGTARTTPSAIAARHAQRSVLMADPNWNRGFYYDGVPPHSGMKLARQLATIGYRSGPEWEQRFGRRRRTTPSEDFPSPTTDPDFLVETYLDYQGEQFSTKYDANSLIYISKAMDLFDMTSEGLDEVTQHYQRNNPASPPLILPDNGQSMEQAIPQRKTSRDAPHLSDAQSPSYLASLAQGLRRLRNIPTLVIGVQSDALFQVEQQRELAEALRRAENRCVVYYELNGPWGHDTFLIDRANIGSAVSGFLRQALGENECF